MAYQFKVSTPSGAPITTSKPSQAEGVRFYLEDADVVANVLVGGAVVPRLGRLSKPRWSLAWHAHRDDAQLSVNAEDLDDGRKVRFIIEACVPGTVEWKAMQVVEGVVRGGVASANAVLEHPGDSRHHYDLRFRAEIVP